MSRNPLGQEALLEIAHSALGRCRRLTWVNLGDCHAGDDGVVGVADAIAGSTRLTHLLVPRSGKFVHITCIPMRWFQGLMQGARGAARAQAMRARLHH